MLQEQGCDAKIASGGGRMGVTMDRCERCAALWLHGGLFTGAMLLCAL